MTQYMLSVLHSGQEELDAVSAEDMQRMFKQVDEFNEEVQAAGAWVSAAG